MTPIPIVLIGAGQRGARSYANYALRRPEEVRIVAVAEPNDLRRKQTAKEHGIPAKRSFRTWEELLDAPLMGDVALIAHPDPLHAPTAIRAMQAGYHVVVQPPMAVSVPECFDVVKKAAATQQYLIVGHSLRYTAFYRALRDMMSSGRLGKIISYRQERLIPFWHVAHQFLRAPSWNGDYNPMLFLEGVHEFDLIQWMLNEPIMTISSVGSNRIFDLSQAPIGNVPAHCVEDCPIEAECPFSSIGIYVEKRFKGLPQRGWPHSAIANGDETPSALTAAVENSAWGECVYHLGRTIIDHQSILMKSQSGVSITLTLDGHGLQEARTIHIDGSHGSLVAEFIGVDSHITVYNHATHKENTINFRIGPYGHGGDHGLMGHLGKLLRGEGESLSLGEVSLNAHLMAFAAENARLNDKVVYFQDYLM